MLPVKYALMKLSNKDHLAFYLRQCVFSTILPNVFFLRCFNGNVEFEGDIIAIPSKLSGEYVSDW